MGRIRQMTCGCGARIVADDDALTIRHEGPECDEFREIIERNKRLNPYVDDPEVVDADRENKEVEILLGRDQGGELLQVAADFGIDTSDPRQAVRELLREMRRRGWKIQVR